MCEIKEYSFKESCKIKLIYFIHFTLVSVCREENV